MNIFATDACPIQSAKNMCIAHQNKMMQESIQLLSTAHFVLDGVQRGTKPTHVNHPSAVFVRESSGNYFWVLTHAITLSVMYTERTGKVYGYFKYLQDVMTSPVNIQVAPLGDFPMCMPDEYKLKAFFDVYKAYKMYLNVKYKEWINRTDKKQMKVEWYPEKPEWVEI